MEEWRCAVFKLIKKRTTEFDMQQLLAEAEDINKLKGNAQTALALQKISKSYSKNKKLNFPAIESITSHFKNTFRDSNIYTLVRRDNLLVAPISIGEVKLTKPPLKNNRATEPHSTEPECIKSLNELEASRTLNELIKT